MEKVRIYIYRVYQASHGTKCIGSSLELEPTALLSPTLSQLLGEHIIIPKDEKILEMVAKDCAAVGWDRTAWLIGNYFHSSHHNPLKELGIGLAQNGEKFTRFWPQYQWRVLERDSLIHGTLRAVGGEGRGWSLHKLKIQRRNKRRMPIGCPQSLWDGLSYLRNDLGPNRPIRKKKSQ